MPPQNMQEVRARQLMGQAMNRRNSTRRQVMRTPAPTPNLTFQGGIPAPNVQAAQKMMQGGGSDWGVQGLLQGPGNWVRDQIGPTGMNAIKDIGPPVMNPAYQVARRIPKVGPAVESMFSDAVTDPYSYIGTGAGGGAVRAAKGLGFAERILSMAPKSPAAASLDRGPAVPDLVHSMLAQAIPRGLQGNPLSPQNRSVLEDLVGGSSGGDDYPLVNLFNEAGDTVANTVAPNIPGKMGSMPPDERQSFLLGLAHDDPATLDEAQQGGVGIGTPQMGGQMPERDQLARLMMEMLGGQQPQQTRWGEQSLQGMAAPLALGGYGLQRNQQRQPQNPLQQQQLRRRMPFMYR